MKKVMVGILILIPIIILVIVALVSTIVSAQAWIAVEDMNVYFKNTSTIADSLELKLEEVNDIKSFYDYFYVKVLPERANRYSVTWAITGDITYSDEDYENAYNDYLSKLETFNVDFDASYEGFETNVYQNTGKYFNEIKQVLSGKPYKPFELTTESAKLALKQEIRNDVKALILTTVNPAIMLVDNDGYEVESNTSGAFKVSSYCTFSLRVEAEHISRIINVKVTGDTVEKVVLNNINDSDDNELTVGESMRLSPLYTPIDSIVNYTIWRSDNEDVAIVDQNGVITAVGVGSANIYVKASKHQSSSDEIEYVESSAYEVTVVGGASQFFGDNLTTSKGVLTFEEIGITSASAISGCVVDGNSIVLDGSVDVAVLQTNAGTLTIKRCDSGSIAINNASIYEHTDDGYVLAVGGLTLKLSVVWQDQLCNDAFGNIVWSTSNADVATVSQSGEVLGVGSGLVTITAVHQGAGGNVTAQITINVQHKLSSVQLKTSNASLSVGIARETVFASERYVSLTAPDEREANYTYILVHGEQSDATTQELRAFYSAFKFEIVSGEEYAYFDTLEPNKLVFKRELEKMGKQDIVVRVSARYPKYEGVTRDTQKEVTITAIYGIEVSNITQLRAAAKSQYEYSLLDENIIKPELIFEHIYEPRNERYVLFSQTSTHHNMAIVFAQNIAYETLLDENNELVPAIPDENGNLVEGVIDWSNGIRFYGDVYGNNHMFSAIKGQIAGKMSHIMISNVTMSNLIMRANNLGENAVITDGSDTKDFSGECLNIGDEDYDARIFHTTDIRIEYCIFENAKKFSSVFGSDVVVDGCIIRNMSQTGVWSAAEIYTHNSGILQRYDLGDFSMEEDEEVFGVRYPNITINNIVVSNSLGTFAAMQTNNYSKHTTSSIGFRFGETKEESMAYLNEHFTKAGVTAKFTQTGFLDTYNWQDVANANVLDTGQENINQLIAQFTTPLIKYNSAFEKGRIFVKGEDGEEDRYYFHLGLVFTGTGGGGLVNEPMVYDISIEDERYYSIYAKDIKNETAPSEDFLACAGERTLASMEIILYGYSADNGEILPDTTYTVDSALISHLHGER